MAKVKDDVATGKSVKSGSGRKSGWFSSFLATLLTATPYKPLQGKQARLWTAVGLGSIVAIGAWLLFGALEGAVSQYARAGIPLALVAGFGWLVFRLVHYPPFADFLIATEAEMNKVSWISREDLKKATAVVITTVLLVSVLLFGVDFIWMTLLKFIGVLQVESSGFGSTA
jgi:preprotein translocase subunit SecE